MDSEQQYDDPDEEDDDGLTWVPEAATAAGWEFVHQHGENLLAFAGEMIALQHLEGLATSVGKALEPPDKKDKNARAVLPEVFEDIDRMHSAGEERLLSRGQTLTTQNETEWRKRRWR